MIEGIDMIVDDQNPIFENEEVILIQAVHGLPVGSRGRVVAKNTQTDSCEVEFVSPRYCILNVEAVYLVSHIAL